MDRAKLFESGRSQAVRLPEQLRFEGTEVYARKLGNAVLLLPLEDPWSPLREALPGFGEDFLAERAELRAEDRESLD
jgi:antitoxin VapB